MHNNCARCDRDLRICFGLWGNFKAWKKRTMAAPQKISLKQTQSNPNHTVGIRKKETLLETSPSSDLRDLMSRRAPPRRNWCERRKPSCAKKPDDFPGANPNPLGIQVYKQYLHWALKVCEYYLRWAIWLLRTIFQKFILRSLTAKMQTSEKSCKSHRVPIGRLGLQNDPY